jgi:hypothetical protein
MTKQGIKKFQWFFDAETRNENVMIVNDILIWKGGTWEYGFWENGTWEEGRMWNNARQKNEKVIQKDGKFEVVE